MRGLDFGLSANKRNSTSAWSSNSELQKLEGLVSSKIIVGRVTDTILNKDYPNIDEYGGENAIGSIFFKDIFHSDDSPKQALPFSFDSIKFPIVNELVLLINLPVSDFTVDKVNFRYYYISIIGLWNHPHHNCLPKLEKDEKLNPELNSDYQDSTSGPIIRQVKDGSTDIRFNSNKNDFQKTFEERLNIHPIQPFVGDVLYQGRWGNSIRFGSTTIPFPDPNQPSSSLPGNSSTQNSTFPQLNPWSSTGGNGDPITIIRNGQSPEESDEGWIPITEKINEDLSSIYATSTQKIPIETQNYEWSSYDKNPPTDPNLFTKPQVIINSDRLVFNAKTDHVLISAEKSVFLGSNSSLNFNAGRRVVIECSDIKLGDRFAEESLILGDTFLMQLETVMHQIVALCTALKTVQNWPFGMPVPNGPLLTQATALEGVITNPNKDGFLDTLEDYKSKVSKTR